MTSHAFHDRREAGKALAERLIQYRNDPNAIVLGLPGNGILLATAIAEALSVPVDVFIARKLRAICDLDCALGAVTETGVTSIDEAALCTQDCVPSDLRAYLEHEIEVQNAEALRQKHLLRDGRALPDVAGKTVIVVDDGITNGATFFAAVDALRRLQAGKIVGAIRDGPDDVIRQMRYKVDEAVTLLRAVRAATPARNRS
jgi:predicted phosphoribosyltransferase